MAEEENADNEADLGAFLESVEPQQEPEYIQEPGPTVQGAYNLKMSPFQPTERSHSAENLGGRGGYPSKAIIGALDAAAQQHAAEQGQGEPPEYSEPVKMKDKNGKTYEEVHILTPEEKRAKVEAALKEADIRNAKEDAAKAAAQEQGQQGLKGPRPMSETAQTKFRHMTNKEELDAMHLEIERQKEQRILNQAFAEEGRKQQEYERKIAAEAEAKALAERERQKKENLEMAQQPKVIADINLANFKAQQEENLEMARQPKVIADINLANFKAQQEAQEAAKQYKKYQFRNNTKTGKLVTGVENVATGLSGGLNGIKESLASAAKEVKPNMGQLLGQVQPSAAPQPAQAQPQTAENVADYVSVAQAVGGRGEALTSDQVLAKVGSTAGQAIGSNPGALQDLGGRFYQTREMG